jgi:predicted metalloprotease with PDZ domain
VHPGSAAEKAGAKADDEIVSINGVRSGRDFGQAFERAGPGATVRIAVRRDGELLELQWKLESRQLTFKELADVPSMTAEQRRARAAWLSGEQSTQ